MNKLKIGVIREEKNPPDKRVALSPIKCKEILEKHNTIEIFIQPSKIRGFSDQEYLDLGLTLQEDLSNCDLLLGVKEVPIDNLIPNKAYMFFSHTIKLQAHNKKLLKAFINKDIKMIDYEVITDDKSRRLIAFGRYAGIVGTYNAFIATGKKLGLYDLKPANQCFDHKEMEEELLKVKLPNNFKIVITGDGRVAGGSLEIIKKLGIRKVTPEEFKANEFNEPVYVQLKSKYLYKHKNNIEWDTNHFHNNPTEYVAIFREYLTITDLYIACHYWNALSDTFFTKEDMKKPDFKIKVIADISCDINGAIPTTIRPSTIESPLYGYDRYTDLETNFDDKNAITVMAVDNLPCELPRSSSEDFSIQFIENVLPSLLNNDKDGIIKRATITENKKLTDNYMYMSSMLE